MAISELASVPKTSSIWSHIPPFRDFCYHSKVLTFSASPPLRRPYLSGTFHSPRSPTPSQKIQTVVRQDLKLLLCHSILPTFITCNALTGSLSISLRTVETLLCSDFSHLDSLFHCWDFLHSEAKCLHVPLTGFSPLRDGNASANLRVLSRLAHRQWKPSTVGPHLESQLHC